MTSGASPGLIDQQGCPIGWWQLLHLYRQIEPWHRCISRRLSVMSRCPQREVLLYYFTIIWFTTLLFCSDLEESVEELRNEVVNRRCRVTQTDVEGMALALSQISRSLADFKSKFLFSLFVDEWYWSTWTLAPQIAKQPNALVFLLKRNSRARCPASPGGTLVPFYPQGAPCLFPPQI
jgi:hypothetical protein